MDKDNYISFDDFFNKQYGINKLGNMPSNSNAKKNKEESYDIANNIIKNYKIS